MAAARPYQVIVWGATGFTGQLVCEHIASQYHDKIRWAMAGRNKGKLETVRTELSSIQKLCKDVPIVVADAGDQKSVDQMVSQADVVIACAGPFSKYSTPVVDASVRLGTTYCDITGEVTWVREMIHKYHEQAKEKKVKIVHCCGYDSAPADLGTLFVVDYVRKTYNTGCKKIDALLGDTYGGFSGGTLYTMMDMASAMTPEMLKILDDPYNLVPADSKHGEDVPAVFRPTYIQNAKSWSGPSIMEGVNTRVVRRSNALLDSFYGGPVSVSETTKCSNLLFATLGSMLFVGFGSLFTFEMGRALLKKFLPAPGQGPSKKVQLDGKFTYLFYAETNPIEGKPKIVKAELAARGYDPGYWGTSRMVLECALCEVLDSSKLKEANTMDGGVLTPATAFGQVAIDRFENAGIHFRIVDG